MPALLEFPPDFRVIVDLAVVDDDRSAIRTLERLASAVEVDDLQAYGPERNRIGLKCSLLIGSAVDDGVGRAADHLGVEASMFMRKSSYSAHKYPV